MKLEFSLHISDCESEKKTKQHQNSEKAMFIKVYILTTFIFTNQLDDFRKKKKNKGKLNKNVF